MFINDSHISHGSPASDSVGTVWLGSQATVKEVQYPFFIQELPDFERRPFSVSDTNAALTLINPRLDCIYRKPIPEDPHLRPVGVVSANYGLIPHRTLMQKIDAALKTCNIGQIKQARVMLSEFGERMHVSLFLPEDRFDFDPGDGNHMALRLEIINSVDGSSRLRVLFGWFRYVCSNGLVVGVTKMDIRRRHVQGIDSVEFMRQIPGRLQEAKEEMQELIRWRSVRVRQDTLKDWVNGPLNKCWRFTAAARALHICTTGFDAEPAEYDYKKFLPSTMPMKQLDPVPGSPENANSLFDVAQALSWIAGQRRDNEERINWRADIPGLLAELQH